MIRWCPILILLFLSFSESSQAQDSSAVYWFQFTDKQGTPYTLDNPEEFLSDKALTRRRKQDIALNQRDLPVNPDYVRQVSELAKEVLIRSKWLNGVAALLKDSGQLRAIHDLSIVDTGYRVKGTELATQQEAGGVPDLDMLYGESGHQIEMLNGHLLHQKGFKGEGVDIAVLDAGFSKAHTLRAFEHLRAFDLIKGTWDVYNQEAAVYDYSMHGSWVLGLMGAYLENHLMGTAPLANYWLLRSEDTDSEFIIEEYAWVAAAEYADSAGAQIINSSLGYTTFNDSNTDHRYQTLDGNTAPVSRAGDIASRKGMLVVSSAGNKGNDASWRYISAPADGDSVLAVGAVDSTRERVGFSSVGPTPDGRIKPDVVAQGAQIFTVSSEDDELFRGAGTSFSAPLVAGMAACLWEAFPQASNMQIREAIIRSASQANNPDTLTGYGIPDFYEAYWQLNNEIKQKSAEEHIIRLYPNPFSSYLNLAYYAKQASTCHLVLKDPAGRVLTRKKQQISEGVNRFRLQGLAAFSSGLYFITVNTENDQVTKKIVKN